MHCNIFACILFTQNNWIVVCTLTKHTFHIFDTVLHDPRFKNLQFSIRLDFQFNIRYDFSPNFLFFLFVIAASSTKLTKHATDAPNKCTLLCTAMQLMSVQRRQFNGCLLVVGKISSGSNIQLSQESAFNAVYYRKKTKIKNFGVKKHK